MKKIVQDRETNLKKDWKELKKNTKKYINKIGKSKFVVIIKKKINSEINSKVKFNQKQVVIMLAFTMIFAIGCGIYLGKTAFKEEKVIISNTYDSHINAFIEAYDAINTNYYGEVDKTKLIDGAIDGMSRVLGDPYTAYMNKSETDTFNIRLQGEYKGIGVAMLRVDDGVAITNIFPNSPADKVGMKIGDIILSVDDKDATKMSTEDLSTYIRGNVKDTFAISIKRGNEKIAFNITKENVVLPSIEKEMFQKNGKKVGYIGINIFASNTAQQFKETLDLLEKEGMDSLIIDVRDNSGGYLNIAIDIISTFLKRDDIILQIQNKDKITLKKDQTDESKSYKVAVLINGNSASASEILAAAFKEVYKADIIGTKSYGKATVQRPFNLPNGGLIKVTIEKWLSPTGISIETEKVVPTINVEFDSAKYSANPSNANDNQIQKAIEVLAK